MPSIPEGTVLRPESELDTRSDEKLLESFQTYCEPTGSEKNLWAYWHTGFAAMPPWTKRNVLGWARVLGPEWTIRVLDGVPGSENNACRFGRMSGPYVATHSADFVRLPLMFLHGGCWLDVGALLMRSLDDVWSALEDPAQPYEFAAFTFETRPGETNIINTWMMGRKGCEMLQRWHETFVRVWGDSSSCDGVHKHPLLRHLKPYASPSDRLIMNENYEAIAKANAIMDYGAQIHCVERLRDLVDKDDGWDGRAWVDGKCFLLPAMEEMWRYQRRTDFLGYKQLELLTTPRASRPDDEAAAADPSDPSSRRRCEAEQLVDDMLANTLMMKFCHGLKDAMASSLADIWDAPENDGTDCAPGTFAEYLRWGATHLRQTRKLVPQPLTPATGPVHTVSLFEPFPI
ncbi:capsule polysaccharide biosynthesis protein [Apiospora kogelbergensis]|uniref:Capsule polysaccharide biosynthesis protein n=1 Tax=Apiospora kogelbergensis TaxID=1337665 RepID=A0AAW0REJ9_9PEZI